MSSELKVLKVNSYLQKGTDLFQIKTSDSRILFSCTEAQRRERRLCIITSLQTECRPSKKSPFFLSSWPEIAFLKGCAYESRLMNCEKGPTSKLQVCWKEIPFFVCGLDLKSPLNI